MGIGRGIKGDGLDYGYGV